ncbi:MAG: VapE domain-containing protein [Bifidobacterium adolescentis]
MDPTGNSRWWTLPLTAINYQHGIDMQQVFAQLAVDFDDDAQWWPTKDEEALLDSCNSEHRSISVIRERLMPMIDLDRKGQPGLPAMTSMELLKKLEVEHPKNGDAKEMTAILREVLGPSKKINGAQKWRVPLRREPLTGAITSIKQADDDDRF